MWKRTYNKTFQGVKRQDVWRVWTDISNWPAWHDDVDYCKLDGKFEVGNHFILKPKGVNPVKSIFTEVTKGYSFTDCTSFFGAKMHYSHIMEETSEGLKITNTVTVTGPLRWLWTKLVVQGVADAMPGELEALVKLAKG